MRSTGSLDLLNHSSRISSWVWWQGSLGDLAAFFVKPLIRSGGGHHQEVVAAEIFWGLWLFPLGVLAYRSGFLPRFLGVWLIING